MKLDKRIIIEFVDEDISKLLEEQSKKKFISELKSLELKYIDIYKDTPTFHPVG